LFLVFILANAAVSAAVRTNWVDRWITNSVDVYVPANRFVTEYHTNVIVRTRTNIVDLFSTNLLTRYVTNHVNVTLVQTNFAQAYRTNYRHLNLTNWTTVLVLKTNYVQRTATNLAVVEIPQAKSPAQRALVTASAKSLPLSAALTIEAARGLRQTPGNQADVRLNMRAGAGLRSQVLVRQWKVQSQDRSVLCFGQDPEFRRSLPFGNYAVEVKVQQDAHAPVVSVRGTLAVSSRDVRVLDQRMLASK